MSRSRQTQGTTNRKAYSQGQDPDARQFDRSGGDAQAARDTQATPPRARPDQSFHDKGRASGPPTDRTPPGRGPTNADSAESGRERRNTEQRGPGRTDER